MSVTRRNITAAPADRDRFVAGVNVLKAENAGDGLSTYDVFVAWHHQAMMQTTPAGNPAGRNAAHRGPVFLPWHRYMLLALELHIQRVLQDSTFGLPYWDWAADGELLPVDQPLSAIWQPNCLGGGAGVVNDGPFAFNNGQGFVVNIDTSMSGMLRETRRGLRRALGVNNPKTLPKRTDVQAALSLSVFDLSPWDVTCDSFRNCLEGWRPGPQPGLHNCVHVWIGGDMVQATSPNDPVFYLNHANVDRIWAAWQQQNGPDVYFPGDNDAAELLGHRLNDRLVSVFPNPPSPAEVLDTTGIYAYDLLTT